MIELWLEQRKLGIGASEAAAAMGISPWVSRFQLWAEKTGKAAPPDLDGVEAIKWGHRLEGPVAEAFEEETGRTVVRNDTNDLLRHPDHLFMIATVDALQERDDRAGEGVLEIKTTSAFNEKEWDPEPPLYYQVQVQHQLAVTGLEWGSLAVLIGGQKMIYRDVERNAKFIATMTELETEFWEMVKAEEPPEPDGSRATLATLKRMYPKDNEETVALPLDAQSWDGELESIKAKQKGLKARREWLENQLIHALGPASIGVLPSGACYSYRKQERSGYTVKPTSFRKLYRKEKP